MPPKKPDAVPLTEDGQRGPRLHKLIIKNFRAIGAIPVEVELDEIVVLVGPNNAGKSSVLQAYLKVMRHGSAEGKLALEDFPHEQVNPDALPEIELQTVVFTDAPGDRWLEPLPDGGWLIREQWTWHSPNKEPVRRGFDVKKQGWDKAVPWGAPNVANARRPQPHRIDAFASPDDQAKEIAKLVSDMLKARVADIRSSEGQEKSDYALLLEHIKEFQATVVEATSEELSAIESDISQYLMNIFPAHTVRVDAKPETDVEKTYTPFKENPVLLMGPEDGHHSSMANQGSGARRTLLWAALKYVSEAKGVGERPHVLLLDEPEICLHPSAVREARAVLYALPARDNWQVMITSHSPVFIDLSRDNTTVVRVCRDNETVESTTLYRPSRAQLSNDDKQNLKLLNICDPYLHEFFFGGRQVVVEGDTEYTAFSMLREFFPGRYADVHIIRARGKGIIPSVARVLLQFSKSFAVLHDADKARTKSGKSNPAWGMNRSIQAMLDWDGARERVSLIACQPNFESALFGSEQSEEKPYNALLKIRQNPDVRDRVASLLDSLLDPTLDPPSGCIRWSKMSELGEGR